MKEFLWKKLARFLGRPAVANRLIRYAKRTPYMHLPSNEDPSYMERYWVFNPYDRTTNKPRWGLLCPVSVRVHHIKREDTDRALHDHPWNARTIILRGWYEEKRLLVGSDRQRMIDQQCDAISKLLEALDPGKAEVYEYFTREQGDTAALRFGEYHTITEVSEGGVYTLFFSSNWKGDLSDAVKPAAGLGCSTCNDTGGWGQGDQAQLCPDCNSKEKP